MKNKISDYCRQIRGVSYKPSDVFDELTDDSITLLRANNIVDGKIILDDVLYISRKKVSQDQIMQPGDILICASSGSKKLVGKAAQFDGSIECTFGAFCKIVRPKENIDSDYLGIYFQSKVYRDEIARLSQGANINNIRNEHVDNLSFSPPIQEEQHKRKIKAQLLVSIIEKRKREREALDKLIKARFVEMFGDPRDNPKMYKKESLGKHADVLVGYPFKSKEYSEKGIPIVGGYNLMQGYIEWEQCKYWPNESGYEKYLLRDNDIVLAMDRPWVGGGFKIARITNDHLPALLIQRTACVRGKDVEQEFLYALLNSEWFAEHCNITGSLVPHISGKDIANYEIILPSKTEQRDYVYFVHQVDKSKFFIFRIQACYNIFIQIDFNSLIF